MCTIKNKTAKKRWTGQSRSPQRQGGFLKYGDKIGYIRFISRYHGVPLPGTGHQPTLDTGL